jgi:hypothetical protein
MTDASTWPQYVYIALSLLNLFAGVVMDGEPRTGKYSAGTTTFAFVLAWFLLWRGGFFSPIGVPP